MTYRTFGFVSTLLWGAPLAIWASPSSLPVSPIGFEPNQGQFEAGQRFSARTNGYRLDLSQTGAHLLLRSKRGTTVELTSRLLHANPNAPWEPLEPLPSRANYFHGTSPAGWKTNIPLYGRVREVGVYPGIDLVYYGTPERLEYDFVVAPGADPRAIRLQFEGTQAMRIDRAGNLVLETPAGRVVQHKPVMYQTIAGQRQEVAGRFVQGRRGEVSFAVGMYDQRAPLVIDPTVGFASFLGGRDLEQGNAIAMDANGNFYVVGVTYSRNGNADVLVRKFAPGGAQVFIADLGGSNSDFGQSVQVGADGSVYVGGQTNSSDFPVLNAFQRNRAGGYDAFLMRLTPSGQGLVFSTFLGGSGNNDQCRSIAVDAQGAVYATGTADGDFPVSQNVFQTGNRGGLDAFVAKFDAQGSRMYSTLLGGGSDDEGFGIAVDRANNAYVTGTTLSDNFPQVNNPFQHSRHGDVDAFAVEVSPTGQNLVYATMLGGRGSDQGRAIAVDANGSAYITGKTGSDDYPTTPGAFNGDNNGGDNDIFVTKLTAGQAGLVYSTYLGSHGNDEGYSIAVDAAGNAYIAGNSDSDQYPVTRDATQLQRSGNRDAVVTVLNPTGSRVLFSTFLGGTLNDVAYGLVLDAANNVYITGVTSSADFPATSGAFQSSYGGGGTPDAFFAQIVFSGAATAAPQINNNGIVNGANFTQGAVAPNSIVSIFGSDFVGAAVSASKLPLPTSLGGVSVLVNGTAAPLFYVGPTQINFQLPVGTSPGTANVQVKNASGTSATALLPVAVAAPAILTASGRAVAVNPDGSLNSPSRPARVGSIVTVYFTGIGPVNGVVPDGAAAPVATAALPSAVTIGGVFANASYVGLSPGSVALAQVNVQIPPVPSGDQSMVLIIGGAPSAGAAIAVTQ